MWSSRRLQSARTWAGKWEGWKCFAGRAFYRPCCCRGIGASAGFVRAVKLAGNGYVYCGDFTSDDAAEQQPRSTVAGVLRGVETLFTEDSWIAVMRGRGLSPRL